MESIKTHIVSILRDSALDTGAVNNFACQDHLTATASPKTVANGSGKE